VEPGRAVVDTFQLSAGQVQVFIDGAEAASRVVELGVHALSDEAVLERIALLGEGRVADHDLLVVQQHVSDGDRGTVQLAQWSDAVVLHVRLELGVIVVLKLMGSSSSFF